MFSERILIGNIFDKKRHFSKKYPLFLKTSYGKIHAVENERKDEEMKKFRFLVLSVCVALIICMAGGQLVMAESYADGSDSAAKQVILKAPSGVKALSSGTRTIKVSWNKVSGADKYQVYRYNRSAGKWKLVRTTTAQKAEFTDLSKNTTYKYKIRALGQGEKSDFSSIVSSKTGVVTKISLNRKGKSIYGEGATYQLKATITAKAPSKAVQWTSSNKKVAVVSASGMVTAKGAGYAKITAKAHNGYSAVCIVTVGSKFDETYQKEMLRLVNNLRKQNSVAPVSYNERIQSAADVRVKEAWNRPDLVHDRYDKKGKRGKFQSVFSDLGINLVYRGGGENLSWTSGFYSSDPKAAAQYYFNRWLNSPGHKKNMLDKDFHSMATSYMYDTGQPMSGVAVQIFLV